MNLKKHYDTLWYQSIEQFKTGQFKYDSLIDAESDTRYGITLLARPSAQIKQSVFHILQKIKPVAPNQYYYPKSDLHITLLSIISCYPNFSLAKINPGKYCSIVKKTIRSISPFTVKFEGLTASSSCIMIQGFPESNKLRKLRNSLRKEFKQSGLQHSVDERYQLQTAHMTVIRFRTPFQEFGSFIKKITNFKNISFGSCLIDKLELVGNNWYQQKDKVKLIDKFNLTKAT